MLDIGQLLRIGAVVDSLAGPPGLLQILGNLISQIFESSSKSFGSIRRLFVCSVELFQLSSQKIGFLLRSLD